MKKTLILPLCICATFISAYSQTCQDAGLGTNTPGSKLEIRGCTNLSNASALNVTDSNASSIFYVRNDHAIGINTTSPASLFSIGSSNQFQVNSSGNLISINNVTYSWPTTQGGANSVLGNNGSGTLSWLSANGTAWLLTGNSSTSPSTNFLGNTDSIDLVFRTHNIERMRIAANGGNVGIGTAPATNTALNVSKSGNSAEFLLMTNSNSGTAATSVFEASNGSQGMEMYETGTGASGSGIFAPNAGAIECTANAALSISAAGGSSSTIQMQAGNQTNANVSFYLNASGCTQFGTGAVTNTGGWISTVAGTTTKAAIEFLSGTLKTTPAAGDVEYDGTNIYITATTGRGRQSLIDGHSIFAPANGGTVNTVDNEINVINPAATIATATINFPSSPKNNDRVILKFTQTVTTITWGNGTLVGGATTYTAGTSVIFTYDSGTTSWY